MVLRFVKFTILVSGELKIFKSSSPAKTSLHPLPAGDILSIYCKAFERCYLFQINKLTQPLFEKLLASCLFTFCWYNTHSWPFLRKNF